MFLGTIAVLKSDPRMMRKYLGMSPLDYLVRTKSRFADEDFVLAVDDIEVYKVLTEAFENVLYIESDECDCGCEHDETATHSDDVIQQGASLLGAKYELAARKAQLLRYGELDSGVEIYVVFSEEDETADSDTYIRVSAFINLIEQIYAPTTYKSLYRLYINGEHERNGVEFIDENATYIDATVKIGAGCIIYPNVYLEGNTVIGENTCLYPGCRLVNTTIGANCALQYVVANEAIVEDSVTIGPFVNLRPNTIIKTGCKVGDFVEVKNSTVGAGSKLPHLSYIGDSDIGERVNVGCGTVFVNYDGKFKHRTTIGNDVFIGCNSNLVAPMTVGDGAYIAAGSTLTFDVPPDELAIGRARQVNKTGWVPPYKRK